MRSIRTFKRKLSAASRLWEAEAFDAALAEVEGLLEVWPGNGHLHILWASLVQLQETPEHTLDEAKQALQEAIELDKSSPVGPIEYGHFLDAVEDDPQAASRAYSQGAAVARQLLIEGLIGEARSLLQLDKKEDALRCVLEVLQLMHSQPTPKPSESEELAPDGFVSSPSSRAFALKLKGPFADQVEELLNELGVETIPGPISACEPKHPA